MMGECVPMGYNSIRIERNRSGYNVHATDPAIEKANRERERGTNGPVGEWRDPHVEFEFSDKKQVLEFVDKAMDIALPADEYSTAFDKLAKEVKGKET